MPPTAAPTATTSAQAMQNLQSAQGQQKTPDQLLQQEQGNLGVSQAQQQVSGLRSAITNTTNLLNQVAPSVQGRAANSLVTSAQETRQVANEQAPISQELSQQTQDYNTANANYTDLQGQASSAANADLSAENQQLGNLQNIYSDLYASEQAQQAQALQTSEFNQQQAEAQREFNASQSGSGSVGNLLGGLFGGGGTTPTGGASGGSAPTMAQRAGGGFNFSYNGQSINAADFAHSTGQDFRSILQQMANKGDSGAKAALNFVGNMDSNGFVNYDATKINTPQLASLFKALTGQNVSVYSAPKSTGSVSTGVYAANQKSSAAKGNIIPGLR